MTELAVLSKVHLFPVRHHSPRTSAVLAELLASVRPAVVLIEGPEDATSLVDVLVDEETRPPVAILGYRTDGTPASSLWPFAAYSPEYVAAKWGVENKAKVAFIDIPIGCSLAGYEGEEAPPSSRDHDHEDEDIEGEEVVEEDPPAPPQKTLGDVHDAVVQARGYRSFEEFWEASFEAPKYDPASFREALLAYADLVRSVSRSGYHRARDAHMARKILEVVKGGVAPDRVVVVVGAAHAAAFASGDVDLALADTFPDPVPSAATLIPFSFPRLAEQLGYGAGNRAPQYYQRAHDAGCNYTRATLEVLVEFTEHLRLRGFMASLADTIEAYRLAVTLADIRGKAEPGLDEVREATIATMCRGDATHVDAFLWPSVIGRNVGKVAARIGKNSLQLEIEREFELRRLPKSDEVDVFALKLNEPFQVQTSILLHRLRVADIPYATYIGKQVGKKGNKFVEAAAEQDPGGLDALNRTAEAWETRWTPSSDVALVEKIVLGDTLEQVVSRVLDEKLAGATNTGEAAQILLEAVVASSAQIASAALAACDRFAATDDDLPSLAEASRALSGLTSYRNSRELSVLGDDAIPALCEKTFDRAVLRVLDACAGTDDAVKPVKAALRTLDELAFTQPRADRDAWIAAARDVATSYAVNPSAAGLAAGLLYFKGILGDDDIALLVGQRLSDTLEPQKAAGFLEGFFEVNATALVKSRPVVAALDAFLTTVDPERFRDALPVLRRAFGALGQTERRYLLENVLAVRKIGEKAKAAQTVLVEKDKETLKAMSADLAKAMDDLDDLL
jgi:hypothetical protein